jgi:hypothetical protein
METLLFKLSVNLVTGGISSKTEQGKGRTTKNTISGTNSV